MTLRILFLVIASASVVAAEPTDARDMLYYPMNPLRKAGPATISAPVEHSLSKRPLAAMGPSEEAFLGAYKKYLEGQRLRITGERQKAVGCLAEALSELVGLQRSDKGFEPKVVSYRIEKVLAELDGVLGEQ